MSTPFEREIQRKSLMLHNRVRLTLDGVAASTIVGIATPGGIKEKLTGFGATLVTHQLFHEMIDVEAPDSALKRFNQSLPNSLPIDGAPLLGAAYYFGGWPAVLGAGGAHGFLHPIISPKDVSPDFFQ